MVDVEQIKKRQLDLLDWIKRNAPHVLIEQKHLNLDTDERSYFNYGYMIAMQDIMKSQEN